MVKALKLAHQNCRISTFTAGETIAVCSTKSNCPKKRNRFELELYCFANEEENLESYSYAEKV